LWLGAVILVATGLSQITNLVKFYRLARDGVATSGTITAIEPQNHSTVRYAYSVDGKSYAGEGQLGFLHTLREATVFYLPDRPYISCLGSPQDLLENEETFVSMVSLTFPTFALAVYWWRCPKFRRWLLQSKASTSHP
jgi:hypothetical protein